MLFGGGCTAEAISKEGPDPYEPPLRLRRHPIAHSSLEHDHLKNGFWAEHLRGGTDERGVDGHLRGHA